MHEVIIQYVYMYDVISVNDSVTASLMLEPYMDVTLLHIYVTHTTVDTAGMAS